MIKPANKNKQKVPKLRFPGFTGEWQEKRLGDVAEIIGGGTPDTKKEEYWNGHINWFTPTEIKDKYIYHSLRKISESGLKNSSAKLLPIGTILFTSRATIGDAGFAMQECCTNQGFQSFVVKDKYNKEFIYYWICNNKNEFISKANGSTFLEISKNQITQIPLPLPTLPEQNKIAEFLTDIDTKIEKLSRKKELTEQYKKGAMQKIFSQKIRFKDKKGKNYSDWGKKKLGDLLEYEQPTKYIVESTEYNKKLQIPVLTAGKTFILGYTDEDYGVFRSLPVIIFDDFTTANHYVDFHFKVKSSAIKILKLKNKTNNLKFIYESIQKIDFPIGEHKRYWISEYQEFSVDMPSPEEQKKIADFLMNLDKTIEQIQKELAMLKEFKNGLQQKMFV